MQGGGTKPGQAKTRPVRTKFWRLFSVESGPTTSSRLGIGKIRSTIFSLTSLRKIPADNDGDLFLRTCRNNM